MKAAVVTFPGSNCDRDLAVAFERAGFDVARVWHKDSDLPAGTDVVGVPGGFLPPALIPIPATVPMASIMPCCLIPLASAAAI